MATRSSSLLAEHWRAHRAGVSLLAVFAALESVATLALPLLAAGAAALALDTAESGSMASLITIAIGILTAQALTRFAAGWFGGRLAIDVATELRVRVFDHLQALPLDAHLGRRRGDLLTLLGTDSDRVSALIAMTGGTLAGIVITALGAVVMIARTDPWLALAAAICVPPIAIASRLFARRLRPLARQAADSGAELTAHAEDSLAAITAVKAFAREPEQSARFTALARHSAGLYRRLAAISAGVGPAVQWLVALAVLALVALGVARASSGQFNAGGLTAVTLYALLLARPAGVFAQFWGQWQQARGAAARIAELLATEPESPAHSLPDLRVHGGAIALAGVRYAYPGRAAVLAGLDLVIRAGETLAVTGDNGAGKTTLAHLILRLHDPDAGHIRIDGQDLREVSLASLRRAIGYVPQQVLLVEGTIAENIAWGDPSADRTRIEQAAEHALARGFIDALPAGFETRIGDQGVRLSGGQRQRIALARALLKDPRILILDEATAMFDPGAELELVGGLRPVFAGRTVVWITHRPAALELAHRVVRMHAGRVVDVRPGVQA
ncbi:MAG: ABC transporter ATP-binding protein [Chromatiales bacterium]|nr:ABC transporter ATP-binding protein [Chromatiales bacterium]